MVALKETNKPSAEVNLTIAEICRSREAVPRQACEKCEAVFRSGREAILNFAAIAVVFGISLYMLALGAIAQPLTLVMKALQDVSKGDLTKRLLFDRNDEIGQIGSALNEALESTRSALEKVNETAEQLGAVSAELRAASEEITSGSKTQAAGLEMAATSSGELTATARRNTECARHANGVSTKTRDLAQGGHQVVADAEKAMDEINTSSEKISRIVEAVNEVAFNTNMLALNAAIEAALAGEHGKSFGVVATEIRELSRSSADCADGIRSLVDESVRTAQKGAVSIHRSGETLRSLTVSVQEVAELVSQIMNTSEKQTVGVEHVNFGCLENGFYHTGQFRAGAKASRQSGGSL